MLKSINNLPDMKTEIVLALLVALTLTLPSQAPIIGIFTLPDEGEEPKLGQPYPPKLTVANDTYIAASYVKFIQMSGAQVVPIFAFSNNSYFDELLPKINGILFTGGGHQINIKNKWTQSADYIFKWAIESNKKGNVFPVWGTCLGWQLLAYLTSGYDSKVLSPVRGETAVINRLIIKDEGYLYQGISPALRYNLENGQGILYFNHVFAVSAAYYQSSEKLKSFWKVTSTTKSSYNEEFISTAEGKDYPIFAIQAHPEKNLYEWKVKANRSNYGAEIVQILSNKFVDIARKSKNSFATEEQYKKAVIYSYKTHFTTMSFTQVYLFPEKVIEVQDKQPNLLSE